MVSISVIRLRYLLLLVGSALAFTAFAQSKNSTYIDFTIDRKDFVDTIPINYRRGQIILAVAIDGETYNLCLDTGATMGGIHDNSAIRSLCKDTSVVVADSHNIGRKTRLVRLPLMRLGSLSITDYPAATVPPSVISDCFNDGVIGFNLFCKGILVKIDLRSKVLILTDRKDFFRKEKGIMLPYEMHGVPVVELEPSASCKDKAIFDTGFNGFYTMNKVGAFDVFVQTDKEKFMPVAEKMRKQVRWTGVGRTSMGVFGTGKEHEIVVLQLDRLRVGRMSFFGVPTSTGVGNSLLGCRMLQYGSVIIDPFRERLIFRPYHDGDTCHVDRQPSDFFVVPVDGKPIVSLINEQSKVYADGMRVGDTVTEVDGKKIDDFCTFVTETEDEKPIYRFSLQSGDGVKKAVVYERQ